MFGRFESGPQVGEIVRCDLEEVRIICTVCDPNSPCTHIVYT